MEVFCPLLQLPSRSLVLVQLNFLSSLFPVNDEYFYCLPWLMLVLVAVLMLQYCRFLASFKCKYLLIGIRGTPNVPRIF